MPYPSGADQKVELVNSAGTSGLEGTTADGTSATGVEPVLVAGQDGTNIQSIFTDTTGRQIVVGAVADGGSPTGIGIIPIAGLSQTSGLLNTLRLDSMAGDAKSKTLQVVETSANLAAYRGSNQWDRVVTANTADGTTGTGLLGVGILGFDATNYQVLLCDTTGTLRVGRHMVTLSDASAVQAAAYAAADLVGGKRTLTNAVRVSGGSGIIRGVSIVDQAANSAANSIYDILIFNSDPSGTTFTENSPLDVADADMDKLIAAIRLDGVAGNTLFTNADNSFIYKPVEIPFVASGTTSLFAALIARGGPTYAATTDVIVKFQIEQN